MVLPAVAPLLQRSRLGQRPTSEDPTSWEANSALRRADYTMTLAARRAWSCGRKIPCVSSAGPPLLQRSGGRGSGVNLAEGEHCGAWWDRSVGYTKLKDRWGIALRTRQGDDGRPDEDSEELWPFNEAPRWMRIEGVGKLPDLLGALLKQADDTTKKIRAKVEQANQLAEAISGVADDMAAMPEGK